MRLRYFICDVFTDTRFGGNQLAVLPEAAGLADRQMQQIAREFNFSESTFVLPPQAGNSRSVRIFTPMSEVPFAAGRRLRVAHRARRRDGAAQCPRGPHRKAGRCGRECVGRRRLHTGERRVHRGVAAADGPGATALPPSVAITPRRAIDYSAPARFIMMKDV